MAGDERVSLFKPIPKPKLKTGLETPKKVHNSSILKEDQQALGFLTGSDSSPEAAYPLTQLPLTLAYPSGVLRQGLKTSLRIYLTTELLATNCDPALGAF